MGKPRNKMYLRLGEERGAGHPDAADRAEDIVRIQELVIRFPGAAQEAACGMPSEMLPIHHMGSSQLTSDQLRTMRQRCEIAAHRLRFVEFPSVAEVERALE